MNGIFVSLNNTNIFLDFRNVLDFGMFVVEDRRDNKFVQVFVELFVKIWKGKEIKDFF